MRKSYDFSQLEMVNMPYAPFFIDLKSTETVILLCHHHTASIFAALNSIIGR